MGDAEGAKKYAEVIALVDTLFHSAKQNQSFHVFFRAMLGYDIFQDPPFYHTIMHH